MTFDETHAYAPPVRHFLLTGHIAAEVDNYERRALWAGIPYLPVALLGALGAVLGGTERAFIAADCIFPALLFLLLYRLAGELVSDRSLRLLVAWSSLLVPFGVLNSVWLGDDAQLAPLEVTRTPQPEISLLFMILAVAVTARAIVAKERIRPLIFAGIASAAIVYCYYYYAIAWGAALAVILAVGLLWRNLLIAKRAAAVLGVTVALAVPYAAVTTRGKIEGGQSYLLARMGAHTHRPALLPLLGALLALFILWRYGRVLAERKSTAFVLMAVVIGALLGMNMQVLSGYETQSWHFWKRLALPLSFFLVASTVASWIERRAKIPAAGLRAVAALLTALLIADTAARLTFAGIRTAPLQHASDSQMALLSWVRENLPPGQVIGTVNPEFILLVPAITADYNYVPSGLRSLTSNEEIVNRYFQLACLLGLSQDQVAVAAAVPNHLAHSTQVLQVLGLSYNGDPAVYRALVHDYGRFHQHCVAPEWRLDLVIVSDQAGMDALKNRYPGANVVYRNERYWLVALR